MRFSLHQFARVFKIRDAKGLPYILIGGQAVNYWAERFYSVEPGLSDWLPFTSEDIDFKGDQKDAKHIAKQLGLTASLPLMVEMTALAGAIPFKIGDLKTTIEVVRSIPGVDVKRINDFAFNAEWSGQEIRVLDPISLLCCKAELAASVSQKERRDVHHLKIMVICVRAFLREALHGVEQGKLSAKGWMGAVERSLTLSESTLGAKISRRFGVDWLELLPLAEIEISENTKAIQLRQKRLPRWRTKIGRVRQKA
jgi:hypothetical protein